MATPYEKKHQDIVNAAIDVFLEKGFLLTTMDAVSAKAGFSKVTVYNHFHDKRELFEHVMKVHCANLSHKKRLISFNQNQSPKTTLQIYAHRMVDLLLNEKSIALMRVVIGEASRFPALAEAIWPYGKLPMQEELADYFTAENKAQRLQIENIPMATRQFFGMIKENLVWPALMGLPIDESPQAKKTIIEQSVEMFVTFYQVKSK